jgi:hypothetical protein
MLGLHRTYIQRLIRELGIDLAGIQGGEHLMPTRQVTECGQCHQEMRGRPATLEVRMVVTLRVVMGEDGRENYGTSDFCSPACASRWAARLIDRAWRGETR